MAEQGFPELQQVVWTARTHGRLRSSTVELLGYRYRPGDEPPPAGEPDPKGRTG